MTTTTPAPVKSARLPLGAEPRVQLLPPAVREREKARAAMRLGVLLVILGVVVAIALGGFGFLRSMTTEAALQAANARTAELAAERGRYIEATRVTTTIESVVINSEATLVAFCRAVRTTLVGSTTPASNMSPYFSLSAS